jgi:hypothetical protein
MTLLLIWLGCVCLIALIGGLMLVAYQRGYDAGATDREYQIARDDEDLDALRRRVMTWEMN